MVLYAILSVVVYLLFGFKASLEAQTGTLIFNRPLPVQNINLGKPGENANRSNIRWFNARPAGSGDTVDIGDDFTIGTAGERYVIDTIRLWVVTFSSEDPNPSNPDLRNSHPELSLFIGKLSDGDSGITEIVNGPAGSPNIQFERVNYADNSTYWTLPSEVDEPVWQVDFSGLNLEVEGGVPYQFYISGTRVLLDGATVQVSVPLHASNAALGGVTAEGADGFYRIIQQSGGAVLSTGTVNSDSTGIPGTLGNGTWNKSSDINIQIFGDKTSTVSGRVLSKGGSGEPNVTLTLGALSVTSDINGYFAFPAVPPGNYTLAASKGSTKFVPKGFSNPLTVGEEDVANLILVEDSFNLSGMFACDPVGGITVTAGSYITQSLLGEGFRFKGIPHGTYSVTATHPAFRFDTKSVEIKDGNVQGVYLTGTPSTPTPPAMSIVGGKLRIKLEDYSGYQVIYLVEIESTDGGVIKGFLTEKGDVLVEVPLDKAYRVRYQAGIGPFGSRLLTSFSKWTSFSSTVHAENRLNHLKTKLKKLKIKRGALNITSKELTKRKKKIRKIKRAINEVKQVLLS